MKKLIALAAALLSVSSFALSANDTWDHIREEVKNDVNLVMSSGYSVFMGTTRTTAFNVCVNGENFNTTKPFPIYKYVRTNRGGDNDNFKKVIVGYEILSFPISRVVTKEICYGKNDNRCKTYTEVETQSVVRDITISKLVRRGGDSDDKLVELFTKSYEIPACN